LVAGALVCWAVSIPLSRVLGAALGPWFGGALLYLVGGTVGLAVTFASGSSKQAFHHERCGGLVIRGLLFAVYGISLYLAVSWAPTVEQVAVVSAVNYSWPVLTVLLATWAHHKGLVRWRNLLGGSLLCGLGVAFVRLSPDNWRSFELVWSYAVMFVGACAWAIYSVLQMKVQAGAGWVFVYMIVTGGACLLIGRFSEGSARPEALPVWIWPMLLAPAGGYLLWEVGVKRCGAVKAGLLANVSPILAALALVFLLGHPFHELMFVGAGLIAVGGFVARRASVPR
jgi:drug/metabolite transporter (DMT)-like permease